ncbi:winged helix-turn-helix DNA-binding protein [Hypnocyclicus thermotrophus]|uniref:Winged helix-turn-helix DNA-binding protein n=1 Tax=Hypnocyclicus thermotrophus TaxID=1627895 RepID=A0AA46DX63_9FUSO|nr:winged helix-turn-helix transcriptional regulator [Hypnocyclicus thermotrophus]TDT67868.1 winged helix-turn-helix DNA-binding protein [Hypnocyclicus thermotrophus]
MKRIVDESDILEIIEKEPIISQRKLSEKSGISLGAVNLLIKKCVKKGFIKIENLNSRTVKYILTPQGIKEKTRKTLKYIKNSYNLIIELNNKIIKLSNKHISENKTIVLLGKNDEIMEIIETTFKLNNISYDKINNIKDIEYFKNIIVYFWNTELEEKLKEKNIEYINIINDKV